MKIKLKILLLAAALCALTEACGAKLDAQGYLQAMLDLSYKNEAEAYVDMGLGTQEEAAALYERGIDSEMSYFKETLSLSEEQESEFRGLFEELYKKASYTVGEEQKQEDGSYIVQIAYRRMRVFEPAISAYYEGIAALPEKWEAQEETPTQEEMLADMVEILCDALRKSIENAEYDEEETLTIAIELAGNVYTPNSDDVAALEQALFDSDYSGSAK
ncbi:MAG: hypothetical protein LUE96_08700 [Lachnospiraceae bacterium]|nr:hypothetical protein [Lachnospiraceae bacterium]